MSKAPGRSQTRSVCQSCGESFLRWEGQCRACSAWNSLVETQVRAEPRIARPRPGVWTTAAPAFRLAEYAEPARAWLPIGIGQLYRFLAECFVAGSVFL